MFILVAYRDSECQHTIKDLFEKAKCPGRVSIGVVWQVHEEEDIDCFQVPYMFPKQVREIRVPHTAARGPSYARHLCESLFNGEEFILQLDSHMRFGVHWDSYLLEVCKSIYI
jgi:hypothetical protein